MDPRHRDAHRTAGLSGRDQVNPQAGRDAAAALWKEAGITSPIDEIDVAEIYVPFSWFEPMWLENLGFAPEGEGWKLTEAGETAIGGRLPVNPSGGVLSSNPIGASGMIRFAEAAIQVMGKAGEHQVTAPARRSATPTAAARSTSRCGWSARTSRLPLTISADAASPALVLDRGFDRFAHDGHIAGQIGEMLCRGDGVQISPTVQIGPQRDVAPSGEVSLPTRPL